MFYSIFVIILLFLFGFIADKKYFCAEKTDSYKPPHYYCRYNDDKDICEKYLNSSACYLVNEECSWIDY